MAFADNTDEDIGLELENTFFEALGGAVMAAKRAFEICQLTLAHLVPCTSDKYSLPETTFVALASTTAVAQTQARVFVEDVGVEKGIDMDSKALTSSLCASLMKQKGVEVICAPDVRQLLDFQSQLALIGKSPAISKIEQQIETTPWVISAEVVRDAKRVKMIVGLHEKGPSEGVFATAGKRVAFVEERVGKASKLLGRVDAAEQL